MKGNNSTNGPPSDNPFPRPLPDSTALLWERNIPLVISTIKVTITDTSNMLLLKFELLILSFIQYDLS